MSDLDTGAARLEDHEGALRQTPGGSIEVPSNGVWTTVPSALAPVIANLMSALKFYRDNFKLHPKRSKTGLNMSEWKPTEALLDDCGNRADQALSKAEARSLQAAESTLPKDGGSNG